MVLALSLFKGLTHGNKRLLNSIDASSVDSILNSMHGTVREIDIVKAIYLYKKVPIRF